jgi:hypothetical protein
MDFHDFTVLHHRSRWAFRTPLRGRLYPGAAAEKRGASWRHLQSSRIKQPRKTSSGFTQVAGALVSGGSVRGHMKGGGMKHKIPDDVLEAIFQKKLQRRNVNAHTCLG